MKGIYPLPATKHLLLYNRIVTVYPDAKLIKNLIIKDLEFIYEYRDFLELIDIEWISQSHCISLSYNPDLKQFELYLTHYDKKVFFNYKYDKKILTNMKYISVHNEIEYLKAIIKSNNEVINNHLIHIATLEKIIVDLRKNEQERKIVHTFKDIEDIDLMIKLNDMSR